jgi:uncharacterized protein YkwD
VVATMLASCTLAGVAVVSAASPRLDDAAAVTRAAQRVERPAYRDLTTEQRSAQDLYVLINSWRRQTGRAEFAWHDRVADAAYAHSADMAAMRQMTHRGSNGSNAGERLRAAGFVWSSWGENIGAGFVQPESILAAWLDSPGHRAVLEGSFRYIGLAAVAGSNGVAYWTLVVAS